MDPAGSLQNWAECTAAQFAEFPSGRRMAELAREGVRECLPEIGSRPADQRLLIWIGAEYTLYRALERRIFLSRTQLHCEDVDHYLAEASSLLNRRKSRAGHSLEAHMEFLLTSAGVQFERQAVTDGHSRPDILFPGTAAYRDPAFPEDRLASLALKTSCRDRWRQILNEARRIRRKDLLTVQPVMSRAQLEEMREAGVRLIVPAPLHCRYDYPPGSPPMTVEAFLEEMKRRFPSTGCREIEEDSGNSASGPPASRLLLQSADASGKPSPPAPQDP